MRLTENHTHTRNRRVTGCLSAGMLEIVMNSLLLGPSHSQMTHFIHDCGLLMSVFQSHTHTHSSVAV